ncbi:MULTISPECIES: hypothetical protein [unclassified Acinetobacter]|uniref:hypothetical protein n=1 Tax=unclassified Acinetobacter TaxID=196816 RepID=UPI0015D343AE|nr:MULTISPECIES: hypothetical protein [unclassified Acinetobacter]
MKLLLIFILFCSVLQVGCITNEKEYNGRFSKDLKENFNDGYVVESYGGNSYYNMVTLSLEKKNFSNERFDKTIKKFLNNGWYLNYIIDNKYWVFCRGKNESIRVLYPNQQVLKDREGNYFRDDLDNNRVYVWVAFYKDVDRNKQLTGCPID